MNGLYAIKPWFVRNLSGIEDRLISRGIGADSLSYSAVAVSAGAGSAIVAGHLVHPMFWVLVAPLNVVRLALNALDGSVARRSGTARSFGKVVNEVSDRVSDAFLIAPLGFFLPTSLVLVTIIVASLVSLCGLLGEAVGARRLTQGPMGKADRCAVIAVAGVVAGLSGLRTVFAVALVVVLVGALITFVARLRSLHSVAGGASNVR